MATRLEELRKLPVLDAAGRSLGEVADVVVEPEGWIVRALVIRLDRAAAHALGFGWRLEAPELPLSVLHVHEVGDAVILRDTLEQLAGLVRGPAEERDAARQ
jgi:sporulation protein YlmC with PRC-barrel domain